MSEGINFPLIIADEAHKLRNEGSGLHNSIKKLKRSRTWLLTGTPLERDEKDIKSILTLTNQEEINYFNKTNDLYIRSILRKQSLRRMKSDVLKNTHFQRIYLL